MAKTGENLKMRYFYTKNFIFYTYRSKMQQKWQVIPYFFRAIYDCSPTNENVGWKNNSMCYVQYNVININKQPGSNLVFILNIDAKGGR